MTSTHDDALALQEGDREERAPLVSWRLATAFIALVAMAVILFWVPVPFVVSSPRADL